MTVSPSRSGREARNARRAGSRAPASVSPSRSEREGRERARHDRRSSRPRFGLQMQHRGGEGEGRRSMPPPSPRRPSRGGLLGERDGPRSVPPVRSPEREGRQGERDGPRAPPSTPRRGRTLERHRRHGRYRDEKDGPHAAPSTPQRVHDFEEAARGWSPSFSPTCDRTEEEEDYDDDKIVVSEYQHDEALVASGEEPVAAEEDGGDREESGEDDGDALVEEQADENPPDQDAVKVVKTHILNLPDPMLWEIVNKLSARDCCRAVCSCRSILRVVRCGAEVQKQVPFVAAVLIKPIAPDVVTMQRAADARGVRHSVSYIRNSFMQMPVDTQIVDCRNGHVLLKRTDGEFYIWNPYLRRADWVPVPQCEVNLLERFVASALLPGDTRGEFYVAAVFATAPTDNTVLKIFSSSTGMWRIAEIAIREHMLHPFSVYTGDAIYFLSLIQKSKSIVKIDHHLMTAVAIAVPKDCKDSQVMISRVSNKLCICKVDLKREKGKKIMVCSQHRDDGQWVESWKHEIPKESYWTRLMGFGEENGILIVRTGTDDIKMLKIADGVWVDMESSKIHTSAALEMATPFRSPFVLQPMDIGDHYFRKMQ